MPGAVSVCIPAIIRVTIGTTPTTVLPVAAVAPLLCHHPATGHYPDSVHQAAGQRRNYHPDPGLLPGLRPVRGRVKPMLLPAPAGLAFLSPQGRCLFGTLFPLQADNPCPNTTGMQVIVAPCSQADLEFGKEVRCKDGRLQVMSR